MAALTAVGFALRVRLIGGPPGRGAGGGLPRARPFAIHYAVEARPYATLLFVSTLSGLALVSALQSGGTWRWAAWGASLAAVLYTHYTGAAVVAAELLWTLAARPAARRDALVAAAIAGAVFVPWAPLVNGERLDVYGQIAGFLGIGPLDAALSFVDGLPFVSPGEVPGTPALLLLAAALAIGLLASPRARPEPAPALGLVAASALAAPLAIGAYSLASHDLFLFPRNLTASLPFAAVLMGWALARPRGALAARSIALATAGVVVGAVQGGRDRWSRPDYPEAARLVDSLAGPGIPSPTRRRASTASGCAGRSRSTTSAPTRVGC